MKTRAKQLGLKGVRVNNAGCLERCELGPAMVIYPEGIWYHYDTKEDVDEILQRHIIDGEHVERLTLEPGQKFPKVKTTETLSLVASRVQQETPNIKSMDLTKSDGSALPGFTAGAHIDVMTDGGKRRSYSIASDPDDRNRYLISILREAEGRGGSVWMHDEVTDGDSVTVLPPINNFCLHSDASEYIFIAGGIGITPILAMGHTLRGTKTKLTLHYCTRSPEETAFMEEVKDVFGANVVFHHDGGDVLKGINLLQVLGAHPEGAHLYVCGPPGLMEAAIHTAAHWPKGTVHREYFAATASLENLTNQEFEISLARHKKILKVPVDKTILEVVRTAGITIDSSCEDGLCGACRVPLLNGTVEHRDNVLSDAEKKANRSIMICVSRAEKSERLVLDI